MLQDNTRDSGEIGLGTAAGLRKDPGELPPSVGQALPGEKGLG